MFGGWMNMGEEPDGKSPWLWSARLDVRYISFRDVEDSSRIVDNITANTEEAALEVARKMYRACLQKEWPELVRVEVTPVMKYNPNQHSDLTPSLRSENHDSPYFQYIDEFGSLDELWAKVQKLRLNFGRPLKNNP